MVSTYTSEVLIYSTGGDEIISPMGMVGDGGTGGGPGLRELVPVC